MTTPLPRFEAQLLGTLAPHQAEVFCQAVGDVLSERSAGAYRRSPEERVPPKVLEKAAALPTR